MEKKFLMPLAALSVMGLANVAGAAQNSKDGCASTPGVPCYPDDCANTYCLGPDNRGVNAPVRPHLCNGAFTITAAGFYWNAHQDGLEFAVNNEAVNPNSTIVSGTTAQPALLTAIQTLNVLNKATYVNPQAKWDFGFKVGVGYDSTCDGWDIGVLWTWFKGRASNDVDNVSDENQTLLPLWSAWANSQGNNLYASEIDANWDLDLNLVDIELGREFWTSKYLTLRPHVGIRIGLIKQEWNLQHFGGSWAAMTLSTVPTSQSAYNGESEFTNNYKGVGVRAGLDSVWNFGCGWGVFGNFAGSILYGRFSTKGKENVRLASGQHNKTQVLDTSESFHSSKGALDLQLGVQWAARFSQCKYGLTAMLGWEHHLFFEQNQLWRVMRNNAAGVTTTFDNSVQNNTGQNVFTSTSGDLSTQGWTLTFRFEF